VLVGLPSPGLRSNGYSLARKVLLGGGDRPLDAPAWDGAPHSLADELLLPSVIYAPAIAALLRVVDVRSIAHITGAGLPGNLTRVLPVGTDAVIEQRSWEPPRIFTEIQHLGEVTDDEMRKVFNLGLGMVVVVPPEEVHRTLDLLRTEGHRAVEIGSIEAGSGQVRFSA
jgi:phosphoribosylformylglycinamidine cyclo-ligase